MTYSGPVQLVLMAVIAVFSATVCGVVAEKKGLSSAWVLLGVLFGLFAVLGVLIIPSRKKPLLTLPPRPASLAPDETICPDCAETIKRAAVRCRYCGKQLQSASF